MSPRLLSDYQSQQPATNNREPPSTNYSSKTSHLPQFQADKPSTCNSSSSSQSSLSPSQHQLPQHPSPAPLQHQRATTAKMSHVAIQSRMARVSAVSSPVRPQIAIIVGTSRLTISYSSQLFQPRLLRLAVFGLLQWKPDRSDQHRVHSH